MGNGVPIICSALLLFVLFSGVNSAFGIDFSPLPTVEVKSVPSENDFNSMEKDDLLGDYEHTVITRENGENVEAYFFYTSGTDNKPVIIFYFEDSTDESLQHYHPFNSDYLFLYWKSGYEAAEERFIFAERHAPSGCIVPIEKLDGFFAGTYSGCLGGVTKTKKTDEGWAVYVKFFDPVHKPSENQPYYVQWFYGDLQEIDEDGMVVKDTGFWWPSDLGIYGKALPVIETFQKISVNSGKISINEFLYKPTPVITEGLEANLLECADDTVFLTSDQTNYSKDDVAKFTAKIKSEVYPTTVYLKIFDENNNLVLEKSTEFSGSNDAIFLVDLDEFEERLYTAVVRFGINGPSSEIQFQVGLIKPLPEFEKKQNCYFYALYDKSTKQLSLLVNIGDSSDSYLDQVQVFVDREGNSKDELNSDDISFVVDKNSFGGDQISSDRGWITNNDEIKFGNTRVNQFFNKYQTFITIPNVSENFKIAVQQVDYNNFELKSKQYPKSSFSTIPLTWASSEHNGKQKKTLASDKWIPDEILLKQTMDVNLVLVGSTWETSIQNKIKESLEKNYKPIVSSELARAGIQYDYNYNFISVPEDQSQELFDFISEESEAVLPFFGEDSYDDPWGIAVWIKNNHTEWMSTSQQKFEVQYKLMDAEKAEKYIYENIIKTNPILQKADSTNLVFLAGDMEKIDFLHNYKVKRTDSATKRPHEAIGLMGYGGNYNFYFFDLYAFPWEDYQGFSYLYDYEMKNHFTNFHDITNEDERVKLLSDYINNATKLIVTPSYLYPPVYKTNYVLDLVIVADPGSTAAVGTLTDYFIDHQKIKTELEKLTPHSIWEIQVTVEDLKSRNLPEELKKELQTYQNIPLYDAPGAPLIDLIDSEEVTKLLTQWATTRTSSGIKDFSNIQKSSWTIPVLLFVGQRDNPVYIDHFGGVGLSPAHPDNPTQPCCALGVTYENAVWDDKNSLTDLALHEVGHTLSLMHPFMGYDGDGKLFRNDYFNWYLSPMTYGSPLHGCGVWFDTYIGEDCGITDTQFTKKEKDNFARGVTSYLIKAAEANVFRSLVNMEAEGQDPSNPPSDIAEIIENVGNNLDEARRSFSNNDLISDNGAIKWSYAAAIESEKLAKTYHVSYEPEGKPIVELSIPEWVKDNADWWGQGAISESDFINSIQYLIKERIIVIPDLGKSGEGQGKDVPDWIKQNASWWANGVISDNEFVNAIQYLVEQGIIRV